MYCRYDEHTYKLHTAVTVPLPLLKSMLFVYMPLTKWPLHRLMRGAIQWFHHFFSFLVFIEKK